MAALKAKIGGGKLLLILLISSINPAVAMSEVFCSSMDGPYCAFVNGRPLPRIAHELSSQAKSTGAVLLDPSDLKGLPEGVKSVVSALAKKLFKLMDVDGGGRAIEGEFMVEGEWNPPKLELRPANWLKQPAGWVRVGVEGEIHADGKLRGYILDESTGGVLDGCTELLLDRDEEGGPGSQGTWTGAYTCHGIRTNLVLKLSNHGNGPPPVSVTGSYRFSVERRGGSSDEGGSDVVEGAKQPKPKNSAKVPELQRREKSVNAEASGGSDLDSELLQELKKTQSSIRKKLQNAGIDFDLNPESLKKVESALRKSLGALEGVDPKVLQKKLKKAGLNGYSEMLRKLEEAKKAAKDTNVRGTSDGSSTSASLEELEMLAALQKEVSELDISQDLGEEDLSRILEEVGLAGSSEKKKKVEVQIVMVDRDGNARDLSEFAAELGLGEKLGEGFEIDGEDLAAQLEGLDLESVDWDSAVGDFLAEFQSAESAADDGDEDIHIDADEDDTYEPSYDDEVEEAELEDGLYGYDL